MLSFLAALALIDSPDKVQVEVGGVQREALVAAPTGNHAPAPVLLCFHGHGGNAIYAYRRYAIHKLWPEAIVVYLQGLPTTSHYDPGGGQNGWNIMPTVTNPDIQFTDQLLAKVVHDYNGDTSRVFAMGHSNGALFMFTLWAEEPQTFAAFGVFAGTGGQRIRNLIPKPAFFCIGEGDPLVPTNAQRQARDAVLKADGCSGDGTAVTDHLTKWTGSQVVETWDHRNGHVFQAEALPAMVDLFKQVATNGVHPRL